jgi:hypothetical protein
MRTRWLLGIAIASVVGCDRIGMPSPTPEAESSEPSEKAAAEPSDKAAAAPGKVEPSGPLPDPNRWFASLAPESRFSLHSITASWREDPDGWVLVGSHGVVGPPFDSETHDASQPRRRPIMIRARCPVGHSAPEERDASSVLVDGELGIVKFVKLDPESPGPNVNQFVLFEASRLDHAPDGCAIELLSKPERGWLAVAERCLVGGSLQSTACVGPASPVVPTPAKPMASSDFAIELADGTREFRASVRFARPDESDSPIAIAVDCDGHQTEFSGSLPWLRPGESGHVAFKELGSHPRPPDECEVTVTSGSTVPGPATMYCWTSGTVREGACTRPASTPASPQDDANRACAEIGDLLSELPKAEQASSWPGATKCATLLASLTADERDAAVECMNNNCRMESCFATLDDCLSGDAE